jgi:SCY1-like protein 2
MFEMLKRDATNMGKYRHPNVLGLVEQPIEDKTVIAYVSEAFEYNLNSIASDLGKRDLLPSILDVKCIVLELIEIVNFLHSNTKTVHLNLAPENIYVTKEGKMKLAGLNFIKTLQSADAVPFEADFSTKIGEVALVPNMKFAAPEFTTNQPSVSMQSDIFSIGCLIYYLVALSSGFK